MSHTAPHIPLHPSERFSGNSSAGTYGDVVEELDWSVGEIVAALRDAGVLENTLVIVTSDNGPFFEGGAGGLKGGKGSSWEGGYKVPLVVAWTDAIAGGAVTDVATMNIDVLPTVAAAVGVRPKAQLDGLDLLPILRGEKAADDRYLYYFNDEHVVGVRSRDWKYLTHAYYRTSLGAFEEFGQLPGFDAPYELLFPANEPGAEAYSLADRNPEVTKEHRQILDRARDEFRSLRTRNLETTFPESRRETE